MTNARLPYLMGGVLVAGFAALSIMSYNALRTDIGRTSEIVFWSAIKDSNDKLVLTAYLERYPNGLFASAGGLQNDAQVLLELALADELVERSRTQPGH